MAGTALTEPMRQLSRLFILFSFVTLRWEGVGFGNSCKCAGYFLCMFFELLVPLVVGVHSAVGSGWVG